MTKNESESQAATEPKPDPKSWTEFIARLTLPPTHHVTFIYDTKTDQRWLKFELEVPVPGKWLETKLLEKQCKVQHFTMYRVIDAKNKVHYYFSQLLDVHLREVLVYDDEVFWPKEKSDDE